MSTYEVCDVCGTRLCAGADQVYRLGAVKSGGSGQGTGATQRRRWVIC
jgi:hypothetical protein